MKKVILFLSCILSTLLFAQIRVKTVSAMKPVMIGQDLSMHLKLDSFSNLKHLFAVSPLNRLEGEVTIIDGRIIKSTVDKKGQIQTNKTFEGKAPFMVYAQVEKWKSITRKISVHNENDFQKLIEKLAEEHGINSNEAFPFMLKGNFNKVDFHIISKPKNEKKHDHELHAKAKKHFSFNDTKGTLVGFYSKHHEGVFTHKGSFTHVHFVDEAQTVTGHLEHVEIIDQEITILLPEKIQNLERINLQTLDTDFSKGRLKNQQVITLEDVSKLHGHLCDGLVLGFIGLEEALYKLYPDSIIDRTNTRIVSRSSPCLTDAAIYLTGGRFQFNTFYVSDSIQYLYLVQRIDNQKTIGIKTKPNVVPTKIKEMGTLAMKGELAACDLDTLRNLEDNFILKILGTPVNELFVIEWIESFQWNSPLKQTFIKSDILNKHKLDCR
jgi:alpha-acetolactate decarboxylase/formylmethanofuran dehydrogenase subunit E